MLSSAKIPQKTGASSGPSGRIKEWNRKLHYYLGLYFLFFLWLFALTGLLLNHGSWAFAEFWTNRTIATSDHQIQVPASGRALDDARQIMEQLGIAGEIQWVAVQPSAAQLDFRVTRPGVFFDIKTDVTNARATVQRTEVNAWGIMRALHTFTGIRMNDARNERDWVLTTLWALSMDAVAVGLIALVASGVVIWYQSRAQRSAGLIALASGIGACGWFLVGLAWFIR